MNQISFKETCSSLVFSFFFQLPSNKHAMAIWLFIFTCQQPTSPKTTLCWAVQLSTENRPGCFLWPSPLPPCQGITDILWGLFMPIQTY